MATGAQPGPGGQRREAVPRLGDEREELAGRRTDAGQGQDVRAVGDQHEVAGGGALTGQPPHGPRPLRLAGPLLEHRVERLPGLHVAERQARGLEAAAPVARQHAPDRDAPGPKGRAHPPRLLPARFGQIALGRTIREVEPGRVPDAGRGRRMSHQDDVTAPAQELHSASSAATVVGPRSNRASTVTTRIEGLPSGPSVGPDFILYYTDLDRSVTVSLGTRALTLRTGMEAAVMTRDDRGPGGRDGESSWERPLRSPPPSSWPGAGRWPSRGPWPRHRAASTRVRPRRPRRRVRSTSRARPARTSLLEPGMGGTRIVLTGSILTTDCRPIAGALLDFWQADDRGEYDNSGLPPPGPPVRGRARPLPARDRRPRTLPGADAPLPRPGAGAEPAGPHDPALLPGRAGQPGRRHLPAGARHRRAGRAGRQGRRLRLRPGGPRSEAGRLSGGAARWGTSRRSIARSR